MDQTFRAIYEHGNLRPLGPVDLAEQQVVIVTVSVSPSADSISSEADQIADKQRRILLEFVKEMESLPDRSPKDGLTNRDHDQILYGPTS